MYNKKINLQFTGAMKEEEDNYRRKFVTCRNDSDLKDHHLMLINVFDNEDLFHYSPNDEVEVKY